jgi:hypothetical protein
LGKRRTFAEDGNMDEPSRRYAAECAINVDHAELLPLDVKVTYAPEGCTISG